MLYEEKVQKEIEKYLTEHKKELGIRQYSFCISANGVPPILQESKDSTILLDMDETLVRVYRVNPELMEFLLKNPTSNLIKPERGKETDSKEVKRWAEKNVDKFNQVLSNYKHKDKIKVLPHKVFGYVAVVFRKGVLELIDALEDLVGQENIKDIKVFTANPPWWAKQLTDALNDYTEKNIEVYNYSPLSKDSKIVDDQEGSAKIKLHRAKVTDNIMDDIGNAWIKVEPFRGDMNDQALLSIIKEIEESV